jgi:hypothetical protein
MLSLSSFLLAIAVGLVSSFTFSTAYDMARAAIGGERQTVSGVWQGVWEDVPAVTVRLSDEGGFLSGTVQFTEIIRRLDGSRIIDRTNELPLVNPKFDGERLCFEVEYGPHPYPFPASAQPAQLAEIELTFVGYDEAELRRTGGQPEGAPEDKAMVIKMKRMRSF